MALGGGKLLGYLSRLKAARAGRVITKGLARALPFGKQSAMLKSRKLFRQSVKTKGPALRTARLGVRYLSELGVHGAVGAGLGTAGVATVVRRRRRAKLQGPPTKKSSAR